MHFWVQDYASMAGQVTAARFFADCDDLRSEFVHGGDIRKARERAGARAGQLEVFDSDRESRRLAPWNPAQGGAQKFHTSLRDRDQRYTHGMGHVPAVVGVTV